MPESAPEGKREKPKVAEALDTLNKKLNGWVNASGAHASRWAGYYADGDDYLFNNQLAGKKRDKGWDRIQVNEIFPAVMQELSILTMRRTAIQPEPWEDSDEEGADLWRGALQWQYDKNMKVPELLQRAVTDGKRTGHWVVKVWYEPEAEWDAEAQKWKGRIRRKLIRHEDFGVDPTWETNDINDAQYLFTLRQVSIEWAVNRWPEYEADFRKAAQDEAAERDYYSYMGGGEAAPTAEDSVTLDGDEVAGERGGGVKGASEGRLARLLAGRDAPAETVHDGESVKSMVTLLEIWFNDNERETIRDKEDVPPAELEAEGKIKKVSEGWQDTTTGKLISKDDWPQRDLPERRQPLYPFGRHVLRVGRDTIISDQAWHLKRWPFAYGVNIRLPHTWHGLNAVEMPKGAQDYRNIAAMQMANYVKQFSMPRCGVEMGALQESSDNRGVASKIRSAAGSIIKFARNGLNRFKIFDPPTMGPALGEFYESMGQSIKDLTGLQDVGHGRPTGGGGATLGEVIRMESATRLRTALQGTIIDSFIIDMMELTFITCKYHWNVGDMVRIVGEKKRPQVLALTGLMPDPNAEPGRPPQRVAVTDGMMDARFDLKLDVTTTMPYDKERKKLEGDKILLQVGPGFLRQWLELYEVPNVDDLVNAHDAWLAVQAVMAAEGEAAAAVEGGGSPASTPPAGDQPKEQPAPTPVAG